MPAPRFSVVIPTFDRPAAISRAVSSVLAQTDTDLEVLVVDDAGAVEVPRFDDPRVRLIARAVNGGPAAARNSGIAEARGDVVTFLDDDDAWTTRRLEHLAGTFDHADVVVCWADFDPDRARQGRLLRGDVHATILDDTTPHLGATAVKRAVCPSFDEELIGAQDLDWWLRATDGTTVETLPFVDCLLRPLGAEGRPNDTRARVAGSRRVLEKHASYFDLHSRAAAFRWRRIGLMEARLGDRAAARRAFLRSLRLRPGLRAAKSLIAASRPRRSHRGSDTTRDPGGVA